MSKIMKMAKGYKLGAVREMIAENGDFTFRWPSTKGACERLFRTAGQLEKGQYLGFQISVSEGRCDSFSVFSSARANVKDADINWIFCDCAAVNCEAENFAADLFEGGRHVYFLERTHGGQEKTAFEEGSENECRALALILKETGGVIRFIAEGGCSEKGMIFISLSEKMPLKMHTALTLGFPHTAVSALKAGGKMSRKVREPRTSQMIEGAVSLLCFFMFKPAEEDLDIFSDIDELKEYDLLGPGEESIEDLDLSLRTYNCLKRAGVNLIETLRSMSDEELLAIRNFGRKNLDEVRRKVGRSPEKPEEEAEEAEEAEEETENASVPDPVEMLDELIGLEAVKAQVRKIAAFARMQEDMRERGLKTEPVVLNMEFVGNPGTAKTTVARIMAGIFREIGLVDSSELIEAGRADLVGRYVGHTAEKVRELFERAKGKVLFIDEAYSLTDDDRHSFGDEAISTLVQEMENRRNETIVIFAGYPKEMKEFFSINPGLKSRVPYQIRFDDYSAEELVQIAELESGRRKFTLLPEAREKLRLICGEAAGRPDCGNGRFCRNLVENAIMNYAGRMYGDAGEPADRRFALAAEDFHFPEEFRKNGRGLTMGFGL